MALPSGYRELAYIKSSGTQYIDTGFKPNHNTRLVLNCSIINSGDTMFVFGSRIGYQNTAFALHIEGGIIKDHYASTVWSSSIIDNGKHTIDKNKNVTTIDGTRYTHTTATFQSSYNMQLFALNQSGSIDSRRVSMSIYSCKIYDNGILVRDFVPAKRTSDSVVGLYDVVNDVFYTNNGTGTFIGVIATGPVDGAGASIVGGTSHGITIGKTIIDGTAYVIEKGKTIIDGTVYDISLIKKYLITVTEQNMFVDSSNHISIDGVYYQDTGTFEAVEGATIKVYLMGSRTVNARIYYNGTKVKDSTSSTSYTFTANKNTTILFKYSSSVRYAYITEE